MCYFIKAEINELTYVYTDMLKVNLIEKKEGYDEQKNIINSHSYDL